MTLPVEELESILKTAAEYKKECENINQIETKNDKKRADFVGINMEGPFISPIKKGAQDERNIIPCNEEIAQRFWMHQIISLNFWGLHQKKVQTQLLLSRT